MTARLQARSDEGSLSSSSTTNNPSEESGTNPAPGAQSMHPVAGNQPSSPSEGSGSESGSSPDSLYYEQGPDFQSRVRDIPNKHLRQSILDIRDFAHHPLEVGADGNSPGRRAHRQANLDRYHELTAERRRRKEEGGTDESISDSDVSCKTCHTPLHKGSDDVPTVRGSSEPGSIAASVTGGGTEDANKSGVDSVPRSPSNKRKFEGDEESVAKRSRVLQDSTDISADTEPMDYGWGSED